MQILNNLFSHTLVFQMCRASSDGRTSYYVRSAGVKVCMMQVEYHREYEASKGTMISVAEDPEMMRMKQVTNVISHASYSGRGGEGSHCTMLCAVSCHSAAVKSLFFFTCGVSSFIQSIIVPCVTSESEA